MLLANSQYMHYFIFLPVHRFMNGKVFDMVQILATVLDLSVVITLQFQKKQKMFLFFIFKDLFALMCSRCNRSIRRQLNFPKELLLVDSTTITVGKTRLLWAPYHGERAGVKLHTALNLSTELPQKVLETTGLKHDSPILDELTDRACIIVADRAYFQIDRSD